MINFHSFVYSMSSSDFSDLEKKAARWNDKQLSALKSNKEKLSEELREAMKKSRKESELHTVKLQIKGKGLNSYTVFSYRLKGFLCYFKAWKLFFPYVGC